MIPSGICNCGCGKITTIIKAGSHCKLLDIGKPNKYLRGHRSKGRWKNPRMPHGDGSIKIFMPNHPRAHKDGILYEHVWVVEKAMGRDLPKKAVIHHLNGNKSDNRNENLLVCENSAYHNTIHRRKAAFEACGIAHWRNVNTVRNTMILKTLFAMPRVFLLFTKNVREFIIKTKIIRSF